MLETLHYATVAATILSAGALFALGWSIYDSDKHRTPPAVAAALSAVVVGIVLIGLASLMILNSQENMDTIKALLRLGSL